MELSKEQKLNKLEIPKELFLTLDPFTVENEIVTPTFKLKRNVGAKVYETQITKMYKDLEAQGF